MSVISLGRLRWWHLEQVLALEATLFGPDPWTAGTFWSELGQVDTRHYVAALLPDEQVVGYAGLCDYPDEAFVQTLAVDPAHQRTGVGARLLGALLAEAERRRQGVVSLEVRADGLPAQRLYARHGFRQSGVRRGYYAGGVDALVLTRRAPLAAPS